MMSTRSKLVLTSLFLLAACSPTPRSPDSTTDSGLAAIAETRAKEWLAERLGESADTFETVRIEEREWSDSCLGLGGPAEACLAALTPGFLVEFRVADELYELRTNRSASVVRSPQLPPAPPGGPSD